ncbi:MAG TPA: hypothetical protein VFI28_08585, partial [Candidatus Limnocylindrales bacterium]|nr:hypothetical protein [Candidatus Limnocylindrales bacterium]
APEQVAGSAVTPATDTFGLGAVTYELLARRLPYPLPETAPRVSAERGGPPPIAGVPVAVNTLLAAALAVDPLARPRPMDLAARLRAAFGDGRPGGLPVATLVASTAVPGGRARPVRLAADGHPEPLVDNLALGPTSAPPTPTSAASSRRPQPTAATVVATVARSSGSQAARDSGEHRGHRGRGRGHGPAHVGTGGERDHGEKRSTSRHDKRGDRPGGSHAGCPRHDAGQGTHPTG